MRTISYYLMVTLMVICYVSLAVVIYWLFYPYKVVEYTDGPLPITHKMLQAEDMIEVHHKFCKFIDTPLDLVVSIEDGIIIPLAPLPRSNTAPGCYDRVAFIPVPSTLGVGKKARVHYTLSYQVNPLRTIKYHIYSEEFEIVSRDVRILRKGLPEDIEIISTKSAGLK